jgi:hypothetical protein
VPAFAIETRAVSELEAPGIDDVVLEPGEDLQISWTPADEESRVRLVLESDQHGQFSPTVIECDVVDGAGSITVPGDMVESFWATPGQCGECPVQTLVRYRRGEATAGERPVLIEATSVVSFYPYDREPY